MSGSASFYLEDYYKCWKLFTSQGAWSPPYNLPVTDQVLVLQSDANTDNLTKWLFVNSIHFNVPITESDIGIWWSTIELIALMIVIRNKENLKVYSFRLTFGVRKWNFVIWLYIPPLMLQHDDTLKTNLFNLDCNCSCVNKRRWCCMNRPRVSSPALPISPQKNI